MNKFSVIVILSALLLTGCGRQKESAVSESLPESKEAKAMLQGIWVDAETEEVAFSVRGDTIFYSDSTSMPAYFKIVGDSLVLSSGTKYGIEKQTAHLFWFKNQSGDVIKVVKSSDPEDEAAFVHDKPAILSYTHQVKTDSVVNFNGERYHWYIAINPTKYKVVRRTYNDDGMEVENIYFDNIMHISVYKGAQCLYSSDFRKQQYAKMVPEKFLEEAVLGNMEYGHIDAAGLHFRATLCIPDGASCYLVESTISYQGKMTMKTIEY